MTTRDDNPRWLATLATALPVFLAALWALSSPADPTRRDPPAATVAPAEPELDLHARSR